MKQTLTKVPINVGDAVVVKRGWWRGKVAIVKHVVTLPPPMGKWWYVEEFGSWWSERDLELLEQ